MFINSEISFVGGSKAVIKCIHSAVCVILQLCRNTVIGKLII